MCSKSSSESQYTVGTEVRVTSDPVLTGKTGTVTENLGLVGPKDLALFQAFGISLSPTAERLFVTIDGRPQALASDQVEVVTAGVATEEPVAA